MRRYRSIPLILIGAIASLLLGSSSASAIRAHAAKATLVEYFKVTSQAYPKKFTAGSTVFITLKAYTGTKAHHAKTSSGTAFLYCTLTKTGTKSAIPVTCNGVVAIGGSMLISVSKQNLAKSSKTSVYPIVGGTGRYLHAHGTVKTTDVDKKGDANAVITFSY